MQKLVHISFPLLLSFLAFIAAFYIGELSLRVYKELAVQAISVGQNLLQSIALLFLWVFFTRLSAIVLFEYILRRYYHIAIPKFLVQVYNIFLLLMFIIIALNTIFGIPITGLLTTVSALGVGLAFGLKDIVADFFAGIALSIEKPFKINEFIRLENGTRALVYDITWRTTYLKTFEHTMLSIPNSKINSMQIINYHRPHFDYQIKSEFYVDHYFPTKKVLRAVHAALESERIDEAHKESTVYIEDINEMGIKYVVRYNTLGVYNEYPTRTKVLSKILENLESIGAKPSFRKIDLFSKTDEHLIPKHHLNPKEFLKKVNLFHPLSEDSLDKLSKNIKEVFYHKDATIVRQGDDGESMFIIAEGLLSVMAQNDTHPFNVHISTLEHGDYFGEFALLTGKKRTATVVARTDCVLFEIAPQNIKEILQEHQECATYLSEVLLARQLGLKSTLELHTKTTPQEVKAMQENMMSKIVKYLGVMKKA